MGGNGGCSLSGAIFGTQHSWKGGQVVTLGRDENGSPVEMCPEAAEAGEQEPADVTLTPGWQVCKKGPSRQHL